MNYILLYLAKIYETVTVYYILCNRDSDIGETDTDDTDDMPSDSMCSTSANILSTSTTSMLGLDSIMYNTHCMCILLYAARIIVDLVDSRYSSHPRG